MFGIDVHDEYRRLQALYDAADEMLTWSEARLLTPVPAVSNWSVVQHLHHVGSMNKRIFDGLERLCAGTLAPPTTGRANGVGVLVLTVGLIPRGHAQAPSPFQPPADLTLANVKATWTRSSTLANLEPHLPDLPRLKGRMPHAVFGRLNAKQFLRFARIHTAHHLAIVRDIDRQRAKAYSSLSRPPTAL